MNAASMTAEIPSDVRVMNAGAGALFALAAVLFVGLALFALARLPLFTLRGVTVDGDVARNSMATLRANAVSKLAGNFFTLNLAASKQAFESVPWVRRAVVRRVWPNRLAVTLEEHQARAYWFRDDADDQLVNRQGEVFEANLGDVEDDSLPTLRGPEGSSAQMLAFLDQLDVLLDPLQARVKTLRLSERGSWEAELDDGARIEIGRGSPEERLARVQRFLSSVPQITSRYPSRAGGLIESADLRYPQGYALRLRGVTTLPASAPGTPPRPLSR